MTAAEAHGYPAIFEADSLAVSQFDGQVRFLLVFSYSQIRSLTASKSIQIPRRLSSVTGEGSTRSLESSSSFWSDRQASPVHTA
jgi:hypothetical protein